MVIGRIHNAGGDTPFASTTQDDAIPVPVGALLLFLTAALIARSWLQIELESGGFPAEVSKHLAYLVVPPVLLVLCWPILREHRAFLRDRLAMPTHLCRMLLTATAIGLLLRFAWWAQLFAGIGFGWYANSDPQAVAGPIWVFACPAPAVLLLYLLVMALLVPIVEEVMHRGLLMYGLLQHGTTVAVAGSSILFGVFHRPDSILAACLVGLVFAVLALESRSLWPSILAHATYNGLIALDWMCLQVIWNDDREAAFLPWLGAGSAALFCISIGAVIALCRRLVPQNVLPMARAADDSKRVRYPLDHV